MHVSSSVQNRPSSHALYSFAGSRAQKPFTHAPTLHVSFRYAHCITWVHGILGPPWGGRARSAQRWRPIWRESFS